MKIWLLEFSTKSSRHYMIVRAESEAQARDLASALRSPRWRTEAVCWGQLNPEGPAEVINYLWDRDFIPG